MDVELAREGLIDDRDKSEGVVERNREADDFKI